MSSAALFCISVFVCLLFPRANFNIGFWAIKMARKINKNWLENFDWIICSQS
jgi:hypothetical protein